ncbi:hypothetical protein CL619_01750 [archaeon]|nr:hypothetical protein [archaeon]|tara:strand:- start:136 stop:1704 length:1569 start_codon:yes stop_codon:yes gene_type:complete
MTTKISLEDHVGGGNISPADYVRAITQGGLRHDHAYDLSTLNETLEPILSAAEIPSEIEFGSSDVYIVKITLPDSGVVYHTLMVGGKVVMTRGQEGKLTLAEPTTGVSDLVDILAHAAVFSGQAKTTTTQAKKKGNPNPKGTPRPHQTVLMDQALLDYFETNATFLAFGYLDPSTDLSELTFSGPDQLERIIDDKSFLSFASGKNVKVEAQTVAAHLKRLKTKISRRVRVYHSELSEAPHIRRAVAEITEKYVGSDNPFTSLQDLCTKIDVVKDLYNDLELIRGRDQGENPIEHYIIGLREVSLTMLGDEMGVGTPEHKNAINSTARWVAYSKAADYVSQDQFVVEKIVPVLIDDDTETNPIDKGFKAICLAAQKVVDPNEAYDPLFLRFVVRGMWMQDLLRSQSGDKLGGVSANTEYTDGFGHYLTRRAVYAPLLDEAFNDLLSEGAIEDVDLKTRLSHETLGFQLYDSLSVADQNKFSRLTTTNAPLVRGSYLGRILRWHVGLQRDEYLAQLPDQEDPEI